MSLPYPQSAWLYEVRGHGFDLSQMPFDHEVQVGEEFETPDGFWVVVEKVLGPVGDLDGVLECKLSGSLLGRDGKTRMPGPHL